MDLSLLLNALSQQRWTILAFLAAVLLAALAGTLAATPQYQAVAVIQLMSHTGKEMDVRSVVDYDEAGYLERRDRARTQIQILLSRSVREEVLRRYNMLGFDDIPADAEGAGMLKEMISAGPREDTQLVEIRVTHPDPERAALLANLLATAYEDSNLEMRTGTARETRSWLEDRSDGYQSVLDEANQSLIDFKRQYGLVDIEAKVDDITQRLSSLQKALGEVTTQRVMLVSQVYEYEQLLAAGSYTVLAGMLDDPALNQMSEQRAAALIQSAEALTELSAQHPELKRSADSIALIEQLIAQEATQRVESDRARIRVLGNQEFNIQLELDKVKEELLEKQRLSEEYTELKQETDRIRGLYQSLGDREEEVDLQALTRLNNVRMLDPALPPSRPASPNIPLNMAMALVVGLAGGLGLALLRHRLSDSVLTDDELTRGLSVPLLGAVPSLPGGLSGAERSLYPFTHPRSPSGEAFRTLRETLHLDLDTAPYRLLVTSSSSSEGRSSVAIGLAIAYARLGVRTLLLDADMHHPHQHTAFGVKRAPGLSESLKRPEKFPLVTPGEVPNLDLITCGAAVDSPDRLLASSNLERLLQQLSRRYPLIIIDSPPASAVSDALVLSRAVDGVVVVARRGAVSHRQVAKTVRQIDTIESPVLGVVLNDVPPSADATRYSSLQVNREEPRRGAGPPERATGK